ncbi:tetratricopeptide repeat protein [Thalassolituus maritimus]|uniref:Tetratricopeptide repeat protein n=1 Tax=Thalassolituus maritimus TaxID=484498 RepID=A0ABQ0A183_9GAMM
MKAGMIVAVLLVSLGIQGCSHERTNKMVKGFNPSPWVDPGKPVEPEEEAEVEEISQLEKVVEKAKKQHGLMHIHRYGEGYDILMTIDAGDSDVKFVMDLPQSHAEVEDQSDGLMEGTASDIAAENHADAEGKISEQQKEKLSRSETMTKHILSAQSLFYKKEYWDALDQTNDALELIPDSAQAHALKGSIYYKMGLLPEARASWEQALELDPELDQVRASLARLR